MGFVESIEIVNCGVSPVGLHVCDGGQCRALREEIIGGPSILLFVGGHGAEDRQWLYLAPSDRKLKSEEKRKGSMKRGFEKEKGGKRRNPRQTLPT